MSERLSEADFERRADVEMNKLLEAVIAVGEAVDPDLESGVMSIYFDDDSKYVVNSHRAARQIWMAAERAAWHFDYQAESDSWIARSNGDELWSALSGVIGRKIGKTVQLAPGSTQLT